MEWSGIMGYTVNLTLKQGYFAGEDFGAQSSREGGHVRRHVNVILPRSRRLPRMEGGLSSFLPHL